MKNRDIKKLFKWKIWKKGTACLLVFSVLLQTVTVSAQGIAKAAADRYAAHTAAAGSKNADAVRRVRRRTDRSVVG